MSLATHLEAARAFDDDYGDGLSNHLPMALLALHRLGAGEERLQAFAAGYRPRLHPARPPRPWSSGDAWFSRLGEASAWPEYRDLFDQWLQHEDAGDVLRAVLPRLVLGGGGAAFHGLIRVAYAVQAAWRPELADALAAWSSRWLDLGADPAGGPVRSPSNDPAEVLRAWGGPARPVRGRLILERVQAVARDAGFAPAVARLAIDSTTLERLARGAATLYAASGSFTLLHLMTSAHAMRVLLPFLDDPQPALRAYWRAWAAGWAASGAAPAPAPPPNLSWGEIVRRALASDDEHAIKAVDTCREQEHALGGTPWRAAAARAVERGDAAGAD